MKSALNIVAFANSSQAEGIRALLETALAALDKTDHTLAAAYVDMALHLITVETERHTSEFSDLTEFG